MIQSLLYTNRAQTGGNQGKETYTIDANFPNITKRFLILIINIQA
jgi:hypothetical protein